MRREIKFCFNILAYSIDIRVLQLYELQPAEKLEIESKLLNKPNITSKVYMRHRDNFCITSQTTCYTSIFIR